MKLYPVLSLLLIAFLLPSSAAHEDFSFIDRENPLTVSPFVNSFLDSIIGWLYLPQTSTCASRFELIRRSYVALVQSLLVFDIGTSLERLSLLFSLYTQFPRCYYFTNLPVAVGITHVYFTLDA